MKKNVGTLDSMIRLTLAVIVTLLYLFNVINTMTAMIFLVVGLILFFTSITRVCPIYMLFGFSSCERRKRA